MSPHNKVIKVAPVKKGPRGISDFRAFFFKTNRIIETAPPIKKAKNRAVKSWGKPKSNPIKIPILTSPMPIHLPRDIRNISKKNAPPIIAANK